MEMYKQPGSKFWTADFIVDGRRYRKSTKQSQKSKADEVAAEFLRQAQANQEPHRKGKAPLLSEFAVKTFLPFVEESQLDYDTKRYYATGWRLLSHTAAKDWRIDSFTTSDAETLSFSGGGSNANCALRTLRRMLSLAKEKRVIRETPKIHLRKEKSRTAVFDGKMEERLLKVAEQPLKDLFTIAIDSGQRPDEVLRMKWENILWDKDLIYVPEGKTETAKRHVPLSARVKQILETRKAETKSEWVFPSPRKKGCHLSYYRIAIQFGEARRKARIPKEVVLYTARHSFATDMLDKTGNIVLVGRMLGHRSVTTTERYLHPDMKNLAQLVNERNSGRYGERKEATMS